MIWVGRSRVAVCRRTYALRCCSMPNHLITNIIGLRLWQQLVIEYCRRASSSLSGSMSLVLFFLHVVFGTNFSRTWLCKRHCTARGSSPCLDILGVFYSRTHAMITYFTIFIESKNDCFSSIEESCVHNEVHKHALHIIVVGNYSCILVPRYCFVCATIHYSRYLVNDKPPTQSLLTMQYVAVTFELSENAVMFHVKDYMMQQKIESILRYLHPGYWIKQCVPENTQRVEADVYYIHTYLRRTRKSYWPISIRIKPR